MESPSLKELYVCHLDDISTLLFTNVTESGRMVRDKFVPSSFYRRGIRYHLIRSVNSHRFAYLFKVLVI